MRSPLRFHPSKSFALTTSAEQIRAYTGPGILRYGFRPFFLGAAAWAAVAVALWLPMLVGTFSLPTAFTPLEWHAHELLFGFLPAVAAGFLLTAVPNWTGSLPILGRPLLMLVLLWGAGRIAVLTSEMTAAWFAAVVDLAFLAVLMVVIGREIFAGRNEKNFRVLLLVGLLFAGNVVFHVEAAFAMKDAYGTRMGIGAAVLLISLIGGRIVPSFTRNWLMKRTSGRLPAPFGLYDAVTIFASAVAIIGWIAAPEHLATAILLLIAGVLQAVRLARWAGERTAGELLVLVLHVAYAFIPIGFCLVALSIIAPDVIAQSGALHSWTAGAIGMMTLAVMTRASLGHTGRELTATWPIAGLYLAALTSAATRLIAAFDIARMPMLHLSATAWVLAFSGFVLVYWPLFNQARRRSA